MTVLKPNAERSKIAIIMIIVVVVLEIISMLSDVMQYEMIQIGFTMEEAENNDLRQRIIALFFLIAFIISIITYIRWFRRAYFNLHLRVKHLEFTEGWAAGAWFVPIISLFRPYQIMKELYEETEKFLRKNDSSYTKKTDTTFVGWWWAIWVISTIIDRISYRIAAKAETLDEINTSTIWSIVTSAFAIPLAILAIKVIKDYTEIETAFHQYKEPKLDNIIPETVAIAENSEENRFDVNFEEKNADL